MKVSLAILSLTTGANAFVPAVPLLSGPTTLSSVQTSLPVARSITRMGLSPKLTANFPRDFANIPVGTAYGEGEDAEMNRKFEENRMEQLEELLKASLKAVVEKKKNPVFTTALIAGDCVILDAIAKAGLLDKIQVVFVDTFFLFPESIDFLHEVEEHYGFKAKVYHCVDCATQQDFYDKYGDDYWMEDIDEYDKKCKVEPLMRALKESETEAWINGRRRDHGFERASLPLWEGNKVNPLAFWSFEDCWTYLRKHSAPYHPLHDVGFSSMGDVQSTRKVPLEKWFTYGGERSGRFEGLKNKDGSAKTECGIHSK